MPMKPHKGESQSDFMHRCMSETFTGDREQDQAVAICMDYWRSARGGKKPPAKEYADPGYQSDGKKRFALDTTNDVRRAWFGMCNAKLNKWYTEAQLSRIKARIISAWKAKIDSSGPPALDDETAMLVLRNELLAVIAREYAPDPEENESHDDFMDRCRDEMSDSDMDDDDIDQACQLSWDENADNGGGYDRSLPVMNKTHSTAASGMEFVLSDATPDRFADVVEVGGWDYVAFNSNPIALFNHDKSFPIGKWANIRNADGKALKGELVLAPKGTSPRIDEIRRLVEADILRAVSVGFRPLEQEPINQKDPWAGTRYKRAELVECSLVAVPANPNALAVAKSLNISRDTVRMVFGEHADKSIMRAGQDVAKRIINLNANRGEHADKKRDAEVKETGEHAEIHEKRKEKTMLLSQRINEAEKHLLALQDNLDKHIEGIDDENPTEEQSVITEDFTTKIEASSRHLKNLKAIEERNGKGAEPIDEQIKRVGKSMIKLPAELVTKKKKVDDQFDYFVRAAVVRGMSRVMGQTIDDTRFKIYGDDEATRAVCDIVLKAASAPAQMTVAGWAQELVRTIWSAWMEVLLPLSVFPKLSASGLALTFGANGKIIIPTRSLTPAISGSFVGEGQPIPVRQGAFSSQTLTPKKMAVITTWTREMDEHSIPAIEGLLRQAILEDTAIALDTILLDTNVATAIRPPGLRSYQAGLTAAAVAGQPYANFIADYTALYQSLITLTNGNVRTPVLIVNPQQTLQVSMLQPPAAAAPLLPFMTQVDGGRILKTPLIESTTVPAGVVIMVDAADFTTAGAEGPRLEISDQATLHMEDTTPADIVGGVAPGTPAFPVKSMWQTDSLALRLIMFMNWVMRRPVVAWTSSVLWH